MELHEFFTSHFPQVLFIYGLAFFTMGLAIFLQPKDYNNIPLVKSLKYLAYFGISHSFVEWGQIFIPIQTEIVSSQALFLQSFFKLTLRTISFMFLFMFGTSLISETLPKLRSLLYMPVFIFIFWMTFLVLPNIYHYDNHLQWIAVSNAWSRYLLCFPGAILSSYALYIQVPYLVTNHIHTGIPIVKRLSLTFIFYAIVGGFFVPKTSFFPGSIINTEMFFILTGMPVQLLRALCGMLMAYYSVKILKILKIRMEQRLERAEVLNSINEERQRFSRDLHDGIVQSIYGAGLHLENVFSLIDQNPEKAKINLRFTMNKLDDVIVSLRNYIQDLNQQAATSSTKFVNSLYQITHDFREYSGIHVHLIYDEIINQINLPETHQKELDLVFFELLTNVLKHANASKVDIIVKVNGRHILVAICDDGQGFTNGENSKDCITSGSNQGLANIKERIKRINGTVDIYSQINEGTLVEISFPVKG